MKFEKDILQLLANGELEDNPIIKLVERNCVCSRDMSETCEMIFSFLYGESKGRYFKVSYSIGMGLSPFQFADDEVECVEVVPEYVTTRVWKRK